MHILVHIESSASFFIFFFRVLDIFQASVNMGNSIAGYLIYPLKCTRIIERQEQILSFNSRTLSFYKTQMFINRKKPLIELMSHEFLDKSKIAVQRSNYPIHSITFTRTRVNITP